MFEHSRRLFEQRLIFCELPVSFTALALTILINRIGRLRSPALDAAWVGRSVSAKAP
jgi:hypothetical protein